MSEETAETLDPDEIANRVLDDMRLLTREEWFEIARKAGQGAPPWRQTWPLKFGLYLGCLADRIRGNSVVSDGSRRLVPRSVQRIRVD